MKGMKQGTTWSLTGQKIIARNRLKLNVVRIDGGYWYRRRKCSVAEDKQPHLMYDSRKDGGRRERPRWSVWTGKIQNLMTGFSSRQLIRRGCLWHLRHLGRRKVSTAGNTLPGTCRTRAQFPAAPIGGYMALLKLPEKVKAIIILVLDLLAIGLLGFAEIYGWALPLWVTITDMLVLLLVSVFGIVWVVPDKD